MKEDSGTEKTPFDINDGLVLETQLSATEEVGRIFKELGFSEEDLQVATNQVASQSLAQTKLILPEFLNIYADDVSMPHSTIANVRSIVEKLESPKTSDPQLEHIARMCAALFYSNSVYREVRAAIEPTDDPDTPVNTIRAWVIGTIWAGGLAAINQFFAPRQPVITVTVYLAQLFGFVMGKICASALPSTIFLNGSRFQFTLNPGPWTLKEQALITMMANVSYSTPMITYLFFMQRLPMYLNLEWASSFGYGITMMLSVQLMGYGLAGICRRFLIYPPNMVWYFVLSQAAMNKALITAGNPVANGWKVSRFKFFFTIMVGAFAYYWIPGTIFPTLTFFNWITWIKPASATVAIVTGTYYFNMGFNPIPTFDYQWFATLDPFVTPWFILVQIVAATAFWGLFVIMPVFFSNTWFTAYLPINSWLIYDNTGQIYETSLILGSENRLNQTAYQAYSPIVLPAAVILRYAGMLALIPALIVSTALYNRKSLAPIFRNIFKRNTQSSWEWDVHYRTMRENYKEVPDWVYFAIALIAFALGLIAIYVWPTNIPGWVFPVAFACSALFIIPVGILVAVTGYLTDLEILFNIVGGAACNGDPIAAFMFKTMGKNLIMQAVYFSSDMKLGHYNKVPPRVMVSAQVVATGVACFVTLGMVNWQLTSIDGICDTTVQERWICSGVATNWTSSIVWGALGPARLFDQYKSLPVALLAGALWPLPWYFAGKKWPNSMFRYCSPLVMLIGPILWAPLNFSNLWGALPVSFLFGYYIKTRYIDWWNKYNYIISTALLCGISLSIIVQTLALTEQGLAFPDWWGTTQYYQTCDFQDCRYMTVAEGETFGPTQWS